LKRGFFARPVLRVARDLVGKVLVHDSPEGPAAGRIVEAEAYRGPEDRAAHSFSGRRTRRTEVMFGPAGHAYVFLVYGMHWNFNVVTGREEQPHAVLIRALEPILGLKLMAERRGMAESRVELSNGPGKLCRALGIDAAHYGADLTRGPIFLLDAPSVRVARSARIGIDYAEAWKMKPWRFFEPGNRYVSGPAHARLGSR
jgi:DNA-3-methyladenine glycosylase